jgi:hypothetical protein
MTGDGVMAGRREIGNAGPKVRADQNNWFFRDLRE